MLSIFFLIFLKSFLNSKDPDLRFVMTELRIQIQEANWLRILLIRIHSTSNTLSINAYCGEEVQSSRWFKTQ